MERRDSQPAANLHFRLRLLLLLFLRFPDEEQGNHEQAGEEHHELHEKHVRDPPALDKRPGEGADARRVLRAIGRHSTVMHTAAACGAGGSVGAPSGTTAGGVPAAVDGMPMATCSGGCVGAPLETTTGHVSPVAGSKTVRVQGAFANIGSGSLKNPNQRGVLQIFDPNFDRKTPKLDRCQ